MISSVQRESSVDKEQFFDNPFRFMLLGGISVEILTPGMALHWMGLIVDPW